MNLGELGEFGLIDLIKERTRRSQALIGIGDDAAVMPVGGGRIVAAADALVEEVHFRLSWSSPADVGWKAIAVNVSDLAAMGADARWMLLTLGAPSSTPVDVLTRIYDGIDEACTAYGAELVGGDTVRTSEIVLSVTALGEIEGEAVGRRGATVGDVMAVSGPLGRAAAGLNLLLSQDAKLVDPDDALACLQAHRRPQARPDAGRRLAGVHAAIDISDGLASDVRRIAEASGVGIEIDGDAVPVAPEAASVARARGWDIDRIVYGGGEDLELLVAAPPDAVPDGFTPIGRVVAEGLWMVRDGRRSPLEPGGWDHFR